MLSCVNKSYNMQKCVFVACLALSFNPYRRDIVVAIGASIAHMVSLYRAPLLSASCNKNSLPAVNLIARRINLQVMEVRCTCAHK